MNKKRKPHIHAEVIKAWADGYKIEWFNEELNRWEEIEPLWNKDIQFRVYDPLREVKEAFERGETIQYQKIGDNKWIDLYEKAKNISLDTTNFKWRVKPKEEFKIGKWVIFPNGIPFKYNQLCNNKIGLRKATKEEVLNSSSYDGTATNKDFPFEKGDWVTHKNRTYLYELDTDDRADVLNNYSGWYYATKQEIKEYLSKKILKPKEYIPFNWEDREQLKGKWVKHKEYDNEFLILGFDKNNNYCFIGGRPLTFQGLLDNFVFLDNSPCGKLKE